MRRKDLRIQRLQQLCDEEGGHVEVARIAGVSAANLWQILNNIALPSGNPRGVGDRLAEKIERAFDKPTGWLDTAEEARALAPLGEGTAHAWPFKVSLERVTRLSEAQMHHLDQYLALVVANWEAVRPAHAGAGETTAPDALSIARRFDQLSGATRDRVFAMLQNTIQLELTADELQQQAAAQPSLPPTPAPAKAPADR